MLWLPRSCEPKTYLIFFSVSCSSAEWQSSISLTKSRFLFSAFSRSCLALSRSCTSCSTCPLPWEGQMDTVVSLTDLLRFHCPTTTSWSYVMTIFPVHMLRKANDGLNSNMNQIPAHQEGSFKGTFSLLSASAQIPWLLLKQGPLKPHGFYLHNSEL